MYLYIGHWMVWWVLFKKAFSDLSSYADVLNTTEGSHGVFISPILPLKWSTICDDGKCPVLSGQPSLTTNVFSVFVLTQKPLECGSAASCFAEQKMLLWAWHAVSAGLTPHPALDLSAQGKRGLGSTAWTGEARRDWGCLHGSPSLHLGQPSLSGSLVPLWWGNFPGWQRGHAEALKVHVQAAAEAALTAQVAPVGRQVTQAVCGVGFLIATKSQLSQVLAGWYALVLDRGWNKGQTALWIRKFIERQDVATFPNSLGIFF